MPPRPEQVQRAPAPHGPDSTGPPPAFPRPAEPLAIGARTARNRVMRLGTVTNLADAGRIGGRRPAHYHMVARGGASMAVTEAGVGMRL